jgi:hypothetical protein
VKILKKNANNEYKHNEESNTSQQLQLVGGETRTAECRGCCSKAERGRKASRRGDAIASALLRKTDQEIRCRITTKTMMDTHCHLCLSEIQV